MMLEPIETLKILQKNGKSQSIAAGEVIFQEGEEGRLMYGIIEGEVELWVNGKVVETIDQGDVFGEGALVQIDHKRASNAIAKTDCQLVALDRERFLFAIQETPIFALQVLRSLSTRLRNIKHSF